MRCPICNRKFSELSTRKIYYENLQGIICKNCFMGILKKKNSKC